MRRFLSIASIGWLFVSLGSAEELRIAGSSSLVQPFLNSAPEMRKQEIDLRVVADSNTPSAIMGVGEGQCDIAVGTRSVLPAERAAFPDRPLPETTIGYQALCFSVSNDVWAAGVRALSKADVQRIYEGTIKNWKALGGPDRPIKFFNPEQGKGVWEFFVTWLYGDMRKAAPGTEFESVGSAEEARNLVEFNGGALGILPPFRADSPGTHALAIRGENGALILPTPANVRKETYPITRPVIAITAYRAVGAPRRMIEFLLSEAGQQVVKGADMVPVSEQAAP